MKEEDVEHGPKLAGHCSISFSKHITVAAPATPSTCYTIIATVTSPGSMSKQSARQLLLAALLYRSDTFDQELASKSHQSDNTNEAARLRTIREAEEDCLADSPVVKKELECAEVTCGSCCDEAKYKFFSKKPKAMEKTTSSTGVKKSLKTSFYGSLMSLCQKRQNPGRRFTIQLEST